MSAKEGTTIVDLDAAIDALYQAPLDGFTAERNALAATLRKAGDKANADRVKALVKPGVTAWAINQAWWRDQAAFRAMLDAGEAQRSAHVAHARGTPSDVRAAADARQQAVAVVIENAVTALGGPADVAPDVRHRIAGTVEALASSGVPRDATPGRLVKDLQSSGLEALGALAGLAPSAPAPPPPPPPPKPVIVARSAAKPGVSEHEARQAAKAEAAAGERADRLADAKARLAERETALRAATAESAEHARAEKKAKASVEAGAARVADLEEKLESARDEERAARRALAQATKVASEAEMMRARTARDVEVAREKLDALR